MTHPIIKTDNYLLVVDELSDVKDENIGDVFKETKDGVTKTYKIIYHLPLNNAPTLEGVPLLPPLEDEEYDFAEIFYNICKATIEHFDDWVEAKEYNKSKAKEKYKYTEEDLRKCWKACLDFNKPAGSDSGINLEDFIQSLQQPKYPVAFDCEMVTPYTDGYADDRVRRFYGVPEPKTITNSQGLTQLVGKYIY
jgi:hypothetical protein